MSARVSLVALLLLAGCKPSVPEARKQLKDEDPKKRSDAASVIKEAYAKDPKAFGDPGMEYWSERLKSLTANGMPIPDEAFAELTKRGSWIESGTGGASPVQQLQLDDYWAAAFHYSAPVDTSAAGQASKVKSIDPPRRHVVKVAVARPDGFTGAWTTYYVNGAVAQTTDYQAGKKQRERTYWENGLLERDTGYDNALTDGKEMQYFADGGVFRESMWNKGKKAGTERTFYETGKLESEKTFLDDKLDGRLTHYRTDGSKEWCIDYKEGHEVGRGCDRPAP